MQQIEAGRRTGWVIVLLSAITLAAFWPVVHCDFTNYDDPYYVTANPHVLSGLRVENVVWAFSTGYYGNWFPLTWLSHMVDMELFGLNAGGHHLTSLLFHVANTVLLFWLLQRMTGTTWPSAAVAALFGLHPLRVESVAWIAERKDVLSTFFFMLTVWAYARYAECGVRSAECGMREPDPGTTHHASRFTHHVSRYYLLSLLFFALGLMSKAMIVTLPCVLLLLDFWPLRRFRLSTLNPQPSTLPQPSPGTPGPSALPGLLFEKVPFLALAAVSIAVTYWTQRTAGAMGMVHLSFGHRLANALVSYVKYLGMTIWPRDLAVLYPHQPVLPAWQTIAAATLLVGLCLGALRLGRQRPYIPVGWFWFLGTLVPALGLIQVGEQALGDRFTYVPSIGLFLLVVWWAAEVAPGWRWRALALGGATALVVALLAFSTRHQLTYWHTSKALLERAISVTGGTAVMHNNLGAILVAEDNWPEAERHFTEALRLDPTYARARISLALGWARQNKAADAVAALQHLSPLWQAEGHRQLAETFLEQAKVAEAISEYWAVVTADPTNAAVREALGLALAKGGRTAEAASQFAELVRLRPDAEAHYHLALALVILGQPEEAVRHYQEAIRLKADWPEPLNDLAWLLATTSRAELRDGAEAVRLAERACELSGHREARFLGTLGRRVCGGRAAGGGHHGRGADAESGSGRGESGGGGCRRGAAGAVSERARVSATGELTGAGASVDNGPGTVSM